MSCWCRADALRRAAVPLSGRQPHRPREKGVPYETVTIDLANRPAWLIGHHPPDGRVPVLEDDGWVLSESSVIDEYLDVVAGEGLAGRPLTRLGCRRDFPTPSPCA